LIPPSLRAVSAFAHDVVAATAAWCLAYGLRFNLEIPGYFVGGMLRTLIWVVPLQAVVFWQFGLYRGMWRYASLRDLQRILLAVAASVTAVAPILLMTQQWELVPRTVLLLDLILLVVVMGGSRLAYRAWKEYRLYGAAQHQGQPVLVLGAGDTAVTLLKELERSSEWRVVGLLDDDPAKRGALILGVQVLGQPEALPQLARELEVGHAIIAPGWRLTWPGLRRVYCGQNIAAADIPALETLARAADWRLETGAANLLRLVAASGGKSDEPETSIFNPR
jgi:FlaA1/EpsC-like NDP-sugar epimerase